MIKGSFSIAGLLSMFVAGHGVLADSAHKKVAPPEISRVSASRVTRDQVRLDLSIFEKKDFKIARADLRAGT